MSRVIVNTLSEDCVLTQRNSETNIITENVRSLNNGNNVIEDLPYGFYIFCSSGEKISSIDLSEYDTSNITKMRCMFYNCRNLTSLDLSNFDTRNVTDMSGMFYMCLNLNNICFHSFNTHNVINMDNMFYRCSNLESLDLSNFDTSNVTDMSWMFGGCLKLRRLDLSNFDISNVISMSWMFTNCTRLSYIKCKQSFKDWCFENQDSINLPFAMCEFGNGIWDIID